MKNIKYIFRIFGVIGIIMIASFLNKKIQLSSVSESCLTESFNKEFIPPEKLNLNTEYNFSATFKCTEWDEILVTQAPYVSRAFIYIQSGVLLPEYDYINSSENNYFLFFINNGHIINEPIIFGGPYFLFSNKFSSSNYLKIEKENANFIYKKYEDSYYGMVTLELIEND